MLEEKTTIIKIDIWSVAKIVLAVLVLWFLYLIRDVILIFFIASLLAAIITPAVNFFERKRIPRWLGAAFVYIIVLLILSLIGFAVIPTVIDQGKVLITQLPEISKSFLGRFSAQNPEGIASFLNNWISKSNFNGKSIFLTLGTVAGQIFSFFIVFVVAFYLSIQKKKVRLFANSIIPLKYHDFLEHFVIAIQKEVGAWGRGLCFLCLFIGVLAYVGLAILGVKYALVLAVIAGFTEAVPYIGPWIAGIIATIVALPQSPTLALLVIALFLVIQQFENTIISPYVMKRVVGLDPLIIIFVLLIGGKIAGPVGMILAVPVATVVTIIIKYYLKNKQEIKESPTPS